MSSFFFWLLVITGVIILCAPLPRIYQRWKERRAEQERLRRERHKKQRHKKRKLDEARERKDKEVWNDHDR